MNTKSIANLLKHVKFLIPNSWSIELLLSDCYESTFWSIETWLKGWQKHFFSIEEQLKVGLFSILNFDKHIIDTIKITLSWNLPIQNRIYMFLLLRACMLCACMCMFNLLYSVSGCTKNANTLIISYLFF